MNTHRKLGSAGENADASRLTVVNPYFVNPAGQLVIRRSVTAFTLAKRFATGRADDALRYLDWVAATGFNELRIFTRVDWTGPPGGGVESGWEYDPQACEDVLVEASQRGLRVELVAHTGRTGTTAGMVNHLRAVDELCLRHDNALLEVWNEPQQNGGNDLVEEVLRLYRPLTPGWASGVYDQTPYPCGPAMTYHSPRKDEWSRCFKDAYEYGTGAGPNVPFQPSYPGPVMLDEPPQVEQTIRDHVWDPVDDWRAYGAGAALFACGGLMHSNPTLQKCEVPTDPTMLACIDAFIDGFRIVPLQQYRDYWRVTPPSDNPGSRRYQRWGADGGHYEIDVRPFGFRRL